MQGNDGSRFARIYSKAAVDEMVRLAGEGVMADEIADIISGQYGLGRMSGEKVRNAINRWVGYGILPGPPRWSRQSENQLAKLMDDGLTYTQIGELLGMSRSAIAGKCCRLGIVKDAAAVAERARRAKERAEAAERARVLEAQKRAREKSPTQCRHGACRSTRQNSSTPYCAEHHGEFIVSKVKRKNRTTALSTCGQSSIA